MTEQHSDQELERIMRQGLVDRAAHAADALEEPMRTRPPRPRGWLGVAAVAAAVVVGGPLVWHFAGADQRSPAPDDRVAADSGKPASWRVESYGGVQVRVPPTWGWGGAPMANLDAGDERPLDCGAAAFVRPGSSDYETVPRDTPYVGRPVMMTDACAIVGLENAPAAPAPAADSVWLDAAGVEVGTTELGDGYVRETVEVGRGTVTVTSDDPALRARILATAEAVDVDDNGCRADATWSDVPAGDLRDVDPESLSVCAYETVGGETMLVWSTRRDARAATAYGDAVELSSATYDPIRLCTEQPEGQWLAVGVNGKDGRTAWTAAVMGECAQIQWHYRAQGDPESLAASPVIPRTVKPWGGSEARAYLVGPVKWREYAGKEGAGMFRGILG
ncbi:hypothetical protein ncot_03575 [Nocardioides sp. JQ2195]|uniref:hypothetical protein n=1 Tax=Nocardioides sp. JQ2195 TaxID=2592334 RepID=UPI00143E22A5|nr:hypothetical protein [Nocardioides sp. JQ2195]QIX25774.1 hypothetical protein ncot_03575 [Nocardioides sp. JQ2195]